MYKKKLKNMLNVKLYELTYVREVAIDLSNGRDRAKLKHILDKEQHRLRKRDIDRYTTILQKTKL